MTSEFRRLLAALLALWLPVYLGSLALASESMAAAGIHGAMHAGGSGAAVAPRHAHDAMHASAAESLHEGCPHAAAGHHAPSNGWLPVEPGDAASAAPLAADVEAPCSHCGVCHAFSAPIAFGAIRALPAPVSAAPSSKPAQRFSSLLLPPPDPPPIG